MSLFSFKRSEIDQASAMLQVMLLLIYFILNIVSVFEGDVALVLLIGFVFLAGLNLFLQLVQGHLAIKLHFFVFLFFITWFVFRVTVDTQDLEYLKQLTIATANGILLYFMLGALLALCFCYIQRRSFYAALVMLYLVFSICVYSKYTGRLAMSAIGGRFYIYIEDGGYQRAGDFMVILSFIASYCFLSLLLHIKNAWLSFLIFVVYVFSTVLFVVSSQVIGSNSATANLFGVFFITCVFCVLNKKTFVKSSGELLFFKSKRTLIQLSAKSLFVAVVFILLFKIVIYATGFDIYQTRMLGFGEGGNDSLESRSEIFSTEIIRQLGFAPFFGDVNVAVVVTGESGRYLHSFIAHLVSWLGFFGLLVLMFYALSLLFGEFQTRESSKESLMLKRWQCLVLLMFFLFANVATAFFWVVFWFCLGFVSNPFALKNYKTEV